MYINLGEERTAGVDQKALEAQREFVKRVTQGAVAKQKHQIVIQSPDGTQHPLEIEGAQV